MAEKIPGATGPNSWKVNQWLKKAVLLSFRLNDNAVIPGGPGGAAWWDKVPSKFAGWDESRLPRRRLSRRARLHRAPLGLYRARRGADAVLRQPRRLCRLRRRWSTPGSPSAPARRSARTCISPAASASAACSSRCRPTRRSSRTTASSARARKWSRASSSARARWCRWACSSPPRPRSSTAPPARSMSATCRPIRSSSPARCRASRCPTVRRARRSIAPSSSRRSTRKTRAKTGINELLRD